MLSISERKNPMDHHSKRIAIFVSFSGQGGVERAMTQLAGGLIEKGVAVDLLLPRATGEHMEAIPEKVNVIKFNTGHTFSSLLPLARYLRKERPDALLAAKHRAIVTAVIASRLAGFRGKVAGNIQTTISEGLKDSNVIKRSMYVWMMKTFYKWADLIVAVSRGVADDVIQLTGLDEKKVTVIYNPVVTPEIFDMARQPLNHPWFKESSVPIILGIGRLTKQKDFHTLVRAFEKVRKTSPCRLVILGDGGDLASLRSLAREMGIQDDLDFPGFQKNPFAWLSRSSLFVLSSRWEGFGIVIVEAMALGIPVVSTDCPNGPSEILKDGRYGLLTPVGNPDALAEAMIRTLQKPLPAEELKSAAEDYSTEKISEDFIRTLLF
jgi:glycosyltransferase involved in cell wall biosynthesis